MYPSASCCRGSTRPPSFIVAETVIVGAVPESYTSFTTEPDTYIEDTKDYILNKS